MPMICCIKPSGKWQYGSSKWMPQKRNPQPANCATAVGQKPELKPKLKLKPKIQRLWQRQQHGARCMRFVAKSSRVVKPLQLVLLFGRADFGSKWHGHICRLNGAAPPIAPTTAPPTTQPPTAHSSLFRVCIIFIRSLGNVSVLFEFAHLPVILLRAQVWFQFRPSSQPAIRHPGFWTEILILSAIGIGNGQKAAALHWQWQMIKLLIRQIDVAFAASQRGDTRVCVCVFLALGVRISPI